MKLSIYNFRNLHLLFLFIIWVCAVLYNERIVPRRAAKNCQWPRDKGYDVLIVSDPQLIDDHTYPGRSTSLLRLSQHITNNYLYKNYRAILKNLNPKSVVFVGDYLDNGRLDFEGEAKGSSIDNYERELRKFKLIFGDDVITNVPGNHDIGWENGVTLKALERFHKNFGPTNVVIERNSHDLVLLDSLSLSNNVNESIYGPPRAFIGNLSQQEKLNPRILFTHVPLWKDDPTKCGPLRESSKFPISKGFQYQTVLSKELSLEILEKVKPDIVFSGDDHDYCEYSHTYTKDKKTVPEITIKSMSMAMGISRPAVQLLTLYEKPVMSGKKYLHNICYLPKPYNEVIIYCSLAFVTLVLLTFVVLMRTSSIFVVMRKHNYYSKEEPVSSRRLDSYLQDAEEEQINLNYSRDLRGSYTYHTTNFLENANRKKNYARFNWLLTLKHALFLFAVVFLVYWGFVKEVLLI